MPLPDAPMPNPFERTPEQRFAEIRASRRARERARLMNEHGLTDQELDDYEASPNARKSGRGWIKGADGQVYGQDASVDFGSLDTRDSLAAYAKQKLKAREDEREMQRRTDAERAMLAPIEAKERDAQASRAHELAMAAERARIEAEQQARADERKKKDPVYIAQLAEAEARARDAAMSPAERAQKELQGRLASGTASIAELVNAGRPPDEVMPLVMRTPGLSDKIDASVAAATDILRNDWWGLNDETASDVMRHVKTITNALVSAGLPPAYADEQARMMLDEPIKLLRKRQGAKSNSAALADARVALSWGGAPGAVVAAGLDNIVGN